MAFNVDLEKTVEFQNFKAYLKQSITSDFVEILAQKASAAVASPSFGFSSNQYSPPITPLEKLSLSLSSSSLTSLPTFICDLINGSRVQASTLFGALVYLERLRCAIPAITFKRPDAAHAALLASLILAGKFLNDASPKNKHWATYAKIFKLQEINAFERQFFMYLSYDTKVSTIELLLQFRSFSHLLGNNQHLPYLPSISSLPSLTNQPNTPKSAVFPPMCRTPIRTKFSSSTNSPNSEPRTIRKTCSNGQLGILVVPSNALDLAPYPSPNHPPPNSFPSGHPAQTKIRELSNSGSMLYRRRTNKKDHRKAPSMLSTSASSHGMNQTFGSILKTLSESPKSRLSPQQLKASSPLPTFTLRSNVPSDPTYMLPTPTTAVPLAISESMPMMDFSLKLPPIHFGSQDSNSEHLPQILLNSDYR